MCINVFPEANVKLTKQVGCYRKGDLLGQIAQCIALQVAVGTAESHTLQL